jgi:hypothetical protein
MRRSGDVVELVRCPIESVQKFVDANLPNVGERGKRSVARVIADAAIPQ